jgi:hypothetical protein
MAKRSKRRQPRAQGRKTVSRPARARKKAARAASAKTKSTRPAAKPAAKSRDALDAFIDAAGAALKLPVEAAWKPAIKANLRVTLQQATLVSDFALPDGAEPAPVFRA